MAMCEMYIECSWPHIENLEHRNLEIPKTRNDFSVQVRSFYYLWVKRFFDIRRETQSFYAVFFIWPPSRAAPIVRKFVWLRRASESQPSRSASSFNSLTFFEISPKPPRASGAWRHPHFVTLFPLSAYCDISESLIHPALARVNTCINVAPK